MRTSKFSIMLWSLACVSDLILLAVICMVFWSGGITPGIVILVVLALGAWKRAGGFDNWRPSKIRRFRENARKMGI